MDGTPPDRELLARMATREVDDARRALALLYERHAGDVLGFLRTIVDAQTAEDLAQETFLAAARNAGSFRHGSARPWLLTIAARRAKDVLRRRGRRREADIEPDAAVLPESSPEDPDLESALARLGPEDRAVLELRFTQGLGHAQVARTLGVSLRAAKEWSKRALEHLRRAIEEEER